MPAELASTRKRVMTDVFVLARPSTQLRFRRYEYAIGKGDQGFRGQASSAERALDLGSARESHMQAPGRASREHWTLLALCLALSRSSTVTVPGET